MKTTTAKLSSLVLDPSNARKHDKKNIAAIQASLKKFGQVEPLVVQKSSQIVIGGNGRLEAMKALGWEEAAIVEVDVDSTQAAALGIALNRTAELAQWDEDTLGKLLQGLREDGLDLAEIGFELDDLGDFGIGGNSGITEENQDDVPEVKESFVKRGEIWELGQHRLMCGDSTKKEDVERLMAGEKADFCFTSPPYSDMREYNGECDLRPEHLAQFLSAPCSLFAVNLGLKRAEHEIVPYWDTYISAAKEFGHKFLSWNVWDKGECGSVGNQTAMFGIRHEWILVFGNSKKLNKTIENKSAGEKANHTGNRGVDGKIKPGWNGNVAERRQLDTVLQQTAQKARNTGIDHPAMFPVALAEAYIEGCSDLSGIVFEPFCGSGSTLIACEKTNRRCFGMEIDEHYCSVIIKRYQDLTGKEAKKFG